MWGRPFGGGGWVLHKGLVVREQDREMNPVWLYWFFITRSHNNTGEISLISNNIHPKHWETGERDNIRQWVLGECT